MKFEKVIFVLSFCLILVIGYIYFFQVSPTFVEKPHVEQPAFLHKEEEVSIEHIIYLLNELDAYKLHDMLITGEKPVIEINIEDMNQDFLIEIQNNEIVESFETLKPDIRIITSKKTLFEIYRTDHISYTDAFYKGDIQLEILQDEKILALKGYKSIYDKLSVNNEITGETIKLNPIGFTRGLSLGFIFIFSFILGIIVEKES